MDPNYSYNILKSEAVYSCIFEFLETSELFYKINSLSKLFYDYILPKYMLNKNCILINF